MKTRNYKSGSRAATAALLGAALLALTQINGNLQADTLRPVAKRGDSFAKGATRLMEHPAPARLPSELDIPDLAWRHTNWHRLPAELIRCPTVRSNHTMNIAIHRMNQNPEKPILVLLHGVLSDHGAWEFLTPELVNDYEVWLPELPGCGDSDAPKPSAIEPDGYSPTAMAERILQALEQQLAAESKARARPVILGGHSLGGTVCIRMLSAPELRARYANVVGRVDRLVLFAPCDLAINAVPAKFLPLLGLKGWMVDVGRGVGVWDSKVRELTKASYQRSECATIEQQQRFGHALKDAGHREAAKAMLREFVVFDPRTLRPEWPWIDAQVADYKNIRVPVLIAHGAWDETLSSAMGHKLKNEIPGAFLVIIPRCSHAVPTEQAGLCAELIRQFVSTGEVRLTADSGMAVYQAQPTVSAKLAAN